MSESERSSRAFYRAQALSAGVRRGRRVSLNDKFSLLVVCPCGKATVWKGEAEYAIACGICEQCLRALPSATVLSQAHARLLPDSEVSIASQRAAAKRSEEAPEDNVLELPSAGLGPGWASSELTAAAGGPDQVRTLAEYLSAHPDLVADLLRLAGGEQ